MSRVQQSSEWGGNYFPSSYSLCLLATCIHESSHFGGRPSSLRGHREPSHDWTTHLPWSIYLANRAFSLDFKVDILPRPPSEGRTGRGTRIVRQVLKVPGGCGQTTDVLLERRDGSGASLSILAYDGMEPPSNGIPVALYGAHGAQPPNTSARGFQLPL